MSSERIVFVTGASGYTGGHVVDQLIKAGYRVRGSVRPEKVQEYQAHFEKVYGQGQVEVTPVDLLQPDFSNALKGVYGVIHVATLLPHKHSVEEIFQGSIDSMTSLISEAYEAGVRQFVLLSTIAAVLNPLNTEAKATEKDWFPFTKEQVIASGADPLAVYSAQKTLAEKAAFAFAAEHPDLNFTSICPSQFLGPPAACQLVKPGDHQAVSTAIVVYNLIVAGRNPPVVPCGYVDVKDVAASLVASVGTSGTHRFVLTGPEWFDFAEAVAFIEKERPALKERLAKPTPVAKTGAFVDTTLIVESLKLNPLLNWRSSVLETVDYWLATEKDWSSKGIALEKLKNNMWSGESKVAGIST